jgi:pimeloyl-ACP methyl ester carboxylesterase
MTAGWTTPDGAFVLVHIPEGRQARGGVIICPSIGPEYNWSYATLRCLADELATRGYAVVRFDYHGTGQSAGDVTAVWPTRGLLDSVDQAAEVLRSAGVEHLSMVGMRLGGAVAATWASLHEPLDALVLWDPSASGQAFLREQRALGMLRRTTAADAEGDLASAEKSTGGVEIPGFVYPPEGVVDLRRFKLRSDEPVHADRLLVVHRAGGQGKAVRDLIRTNHAESLAVEGIEEMLLVGQVPTPAVGEVADWISAAKPRPLVTVGPTGLLSELELGTAYDGRQIRERVVSLGPFGLFGVETFLAGDHAAVFAPPDSLGTDNHAAADCSPPAVDHRSPTVVFLDVAAEPATGPGRLWVTASRALALSGVHAVRYNSSGIGDSPTRPDQRRNSIYSPEALDDAVDVAHHLEPADPTRVVFVGQCSGAYNALEAGLRLGVSGVCAINPILDGEFTDFVNADAGQRRVIVQRRSWTRRFSRHPFGDRIRLLIPEVGWRVLDRLRVVPSPARGIEPLVTGGTDVLLVCGNDDGRRFTRRGGWITRRLVLGGQLRFELVEGLDHALLLNDQQQTVKTLLIEHILLHFDTESLTPA